MRCARCASAPTNSTTCAACASSSRTSSTSSACSGSIVATCGWSAATTSRAGCRWSWKGRGCTRSCSKCRCWPSSARPGRWASMARLTRPKGCVGCRPRSTGSTPRSATKTAASPISARAGATRRPGRTGWCRGWRSCWGRSSPAPATSISPAATAWCRRARWRMNGCRRTRRWVRACAIRRRRRSRPGRRSTAATSASRSPT